jgi:osmotically inducible lipoprotein OsmB
MEQLPHDTCWLCGLRQKHREKPFILEQIRLLNADVIDLYSRVDVGTKIIVLPNRATVATIAAAVPTPARQTYDPRSSNIYWGRLNSVSSRGRGSRFALTQRILASLSLTKEIAMRSVIKTGMFVLMLAAMPIAAQAGTLEGVAIGAGTGAVIAGPPGAVVGGVIGGVVGGPNVVGHRHRHCWINDNGYRHCSWR